MRRLIGIALVLLVVVVLGVAQLVLPGIAASRLRDQLSSHGQVLSVRVSAFPAIELLWHRAGTVDIRMASYRSGTGDLDGKLAQTGDVGTLHVSAGEFTDGLLTVHDASLTKRGNQLTASAMVAESDLQSAVPFLSSVTPVASSDGQLTLRGTASALGLSLTAEATVRAQGGDLVVSPDIPFVPTITLFHAEGISVDGVSAAPTAGGFSVTATGTQR